MTDDIHPLAAGFPAADDEAWRKLAEAALKGADIERITRQTLDGVTRGPLFTRAHLEEVGDVGAPGSAPFVRGNRPARDPYLPWQIRQTVADPAPAAANRAILADLDGGVSEIRLRLDASGTSGTAVRTLDELETVLDAVMLDLAPVHLFAHASPQAAALMVALFEARNLDPETLHGGLGLDPVALGTQGFERAARIAREVRARFAALKIITIDAGAPYEAGGSEAQELAHAAAAGAAQMRALIDEGLSPDEAAGTIEFSFAADADIHLTIAKLRAARRIWARVCEAFGCSANARGMALHAVTGKRMLTRRDAWTNLIRNACAGLAAAAGGADAITVRPFTDARGAPTRFARRLARNLQIMLAEESHLGKVADPAGGGYLHETLGQRLADKGWALFQEIEREGGLAAALKSGRLAGEIETVRQLRRNAYATGKESLIGVSTYPELDAKPVETGEHDYTAPALDTPVIEAETLDAMVKAARAGARLPGEATPEPVFEPVRFAEPFEALRDAADAHGEKTGSRPKAFLATLGTLADFNARAAFAKNRLAVGGVETPEPEVHDTIEACAARFKAEATPLAVICGTDEAYGEDAAALAARLKQAGAKEIWLAGKPSDFAGIHRFIHMRSDAVEDLRAAHAILGVA